MATYEVNVEEVEPMSRTYQYRKVMKPMLERKRRARINKCLDELKDLMVGALQSEGESITKLEKADVLELTVRHLRKLKQHHALAIPAQNHAHEKFRAGFGHCAAEVRRFVQAVPGVDMHVSARLLNHLGQWMSQMDKVPSTPMSTTVSPITSPIPPPSIAPPMNMPRVYTPPASPEIRTPPVIHPTVSAPQPLSLTMKSKDSSPPTSGSSNNFYPQQRTTNSHQILTTKPDTHLPHQPTQPSSPASSVNSEPINYSPRPSSTGIKIEVPAGSPVWRPWSA
ncbi:Enhancer of split mgamma protein [Armadillidium nasatum]|uniref:Enhancer of split mgamma protein n=1 Tax=Armadillidium nasatum TaxID=96803 RepID=A0A5N5TB16_9CRUS|nr:Enhancer of split mgamma protein [Armadillidium nasatum]